MSHDTHPLLISTIAAYGDAIAQVGMIRAAITAACDQDDAERVAILEEQLVEAEAAAAVALRNALLAVVERPGVTTDDT